MSDQGEQKQDPPDDIAGVSDDSQKSTTRRPGRPSINITAQERQERSRQCARECRTRKNLRYQYLEQLVKIKEKLVFRLRGEIELQKKWCKDLDKGIVPEDLKQEINEGNFGEETSFQQHNLPGTSSTASRDIMRSRKSELSVDSSLLMGKSKLYSLLTGQYKPSQEEASSSHFEEQSKSEGEQSSDEARRESQIILVARSSSDEDTTDEDIVNWILQNEDTLSGFKSHFSSQSQSSAISDVSSGSSNPSHTTSDIIASSWLSSLSTCSAPMTSSTFQARQTHLPTSLPFDPMFHQTSGELQMSMPSDQSLIDIQHSNPSYIYRRSGQFYTQQRMETNIPILHERPRVSHTYPQSDTISPYTEPTPFSAHQSRLTQRSRTEEQQFISDSFRSTHHIQGLSNLSTDRRQLPQTSMIDVFRKHDTQSASNLYNPVRREHQYGDRSMSRSPVSRELEVIPTRQRRNSSPEIRVNVARRDIEPGIQRSTSESTTTSEELTEEFS